jgi:hypothetical protein
VDESTIRDQIRVECPLCGNTHVYDAEVTQASIAYAIAPPPRAFTRLFTCPDKGPFQATIQMYGGTRDVVVIGLHEPDDSESREEDS